MRTFKLNIINSQSAEGFTQQTIDYRGVLMTRYMSEAADYLVTVELNGEECNFNSAADAIRWIEDDLNATEFHAYYLSDADLHREWSVR
jgi:hypothetical protein